MFFGRLVELGPAERIFARPRHPYTARLVATLGAQAAGEDDVEPAAPADPSGCRYRSRCPRAAVVCAPQVPAMRVLDGAEVACHHPLD